MRRLQNWELVLQSFSGGLRIFRSTQNQLNVSEDEEPLRIDLYCSDILYINYTELNDLKPSEENLIFTNKYASNSESSTAYHLESFVSQKNSETESNNQKPFLALEIHLGILLDHFEESAETVTYLLDFKTRKTYWKYFFSQTRTPFLHNLIIKQNTDEDAFESVKEGDVLTITSKKPLPLVQNPKEYYQLVQKSTDLNMPDNIILTHLPIPSPEQLYRSEDSSIKTFFSHIYVYL